MALPKKILLILYLLLLFPVVADTQIDTSTNINSVALLQINNFTASPAFVSQNQLLDIIANVENQGNIAVNATLLINITDPGNNTVANLVLTPLLITPGNEVVFTTAWDTNTHPLGQYKVVGIVQFGPNMTVPVITGFTIQSVTPPISSGGGGGGSASQPPASPLPTEEITPPEDGSLAPPEELLPSLPPLEPSVEQALGDSKVQFIKYPVIEEVRPGETITTDIVISNTGDREITKPTVDVKGVPSDWVELNTPDVALPPAEKKTVNLGFTIPGGAFPGNYLVTTSLKNGESEAKNFFILRVRAYPAQLERPVVTRKVSVDTLKSSSKVTLKVENSGRYIKRLEVVEDIPKEVAGHVDEIDFTVTPSEIIEADPVVKWRLEDIDYYESRTITYEVPHRLDEYDLLVNWPIKQINTLYEIKEPKESLEIMKVESATLLPGEKGYVNLTLTNNGEVPVSFELSPLLPDGWLHDPSFYHGLLSPGENSIFTFEVTPSESADYGVYAAEFRVDFGDKTIKRDATILIREAQNRDLPYEWFLYLLGLSASAVIIVVGARRFSRGRKKKVYREDLVSTVQSLHEEIVNGK